MAGVVRVIGKVHGVQGVALATISHVPEFGLARGSVTSTAMRSYKDWSFWSLSF